MATAPKKAACSTCGKEKGGVRCEGCSKIFCLTHFDAHRQDLNQQLDEIQVTRDLFRQSLTEKISAPNKHALIEQIDRWENDSINKIRQAAEEARQILLQHTAEINKKLEEKLNNLTDQIRQGQEEKEFFEDDLAQWKDQLKQMRNELEKPSNLIVREDRKPLVTRIDIHIFAEKPNIQPNRTVEVPTPSTNPPRQPVSCSFCNEQFSPTNIGEHLMICGNKTDQCQNCKRYIRRAVFRYHYENNCADLEEFDNDNRNRSANSINPAVLPQPYNRSQLLRRSNTNNAEFNQMPSTTRTVNSVIQRAIRQRANLARPLNDEQADNPAMIPCEICEEPIDWRDFEEHLEMCARRGQRQTQDQSIQTNTNNQADNSTTRCKYCNVEIPRRNLPNHQIKCSLTTRYKNS